MESLSQSNFDGDVTSGDESGDLPAQADVELPPPDLEAPAPPLQEEAVGEKSRRTRRAQRHVEAVFGQYLYNRGA